jgi:hypothetical protein
MILSKDETLSQRLAHQLVSKRIKSAIPSEEELEKYLKMSNQLNTSELADVF